MTFDEFKLAAWEIKNQMQTGTLEKGEGNRLLRDLRDKYRIAREARGVDLDKI
jgi:hypothetical protein